MQRTDHVSPEARAGPGSGGRRGAAVRLRAASGLTGQRGDRAAGADQGADRRAAGGRGGEARRPVRVPPRADPRGRLSAAARPRAPRPAPPHRRHARTDCSPTRPSRGWRTWRTTTQRRRLGQGADVRRTGRQASGRAVRADERRGAVHARRRSCPTAGHTTPPRRLLRARGLAHERLGNFDLARADHEAALVAARLDGDRRAEWQALIDLGFLWAAATTNRRVLTSPKPSTWRASSTTHRRWRTA